MAEEPEEVLVEDRRSPSLYLVYVGAEVSVGPQQDHGGMRTGKAIRIRRAVTSMFQVKIGIRNIVIPGARR